MPSGLVPNDMLAIMHQSTPPNPHKRSYDVMVSSSSDDEATSSSGPNTPTAHRKPSLILPHTPNHFAVRLSTGQKTIKRSHGATASSSDSSSSTSSVYRPLSQGIMRSVPSTLKASTQQTYYSEKSYPTPMAPLTRESLAVQVQEIKDCRKALKRDGTTKAAKKRDKRARKRVFRVKRDRTYRVPYPDFVEVIEVEVPAPAPVRSNPRLGTTPSIPSPLHLPSPLLGLETAKAVEESHVLSASFEGDGLQAAKKSTGILKAEIPDTDDELTEIEEVEVSKEEVSSDADKTEVEEVKDTDEEEATDGEEISDCEEASDDQVIPDGEVADDTENLSSFEYDDPDLENDNDDSEHSDFGETLAGRRKAKSKPGPNPNRNSKPIANLFQARRAHLEGEAEPQLEQELSFPRNGLGTNNLYGYSTTLLPVPRVLKKK